MKRKICAALSVLLLCLLVVPISSIYAFPNGSAYGKMGIISDSEWGPEVSRTDLATDNDDNTSIYLNSAQFITIDLGQDVDIHGMRLKADDSGSNGMKVIFYDSSKKEVYSFWTHSQFFYPKGADGTFRTITERLEIKKDVRYISFFSTNAVNLFEYDVFDTFSPSEPEPNPEPNPQPEPSSDRAILVVTMITGLEKEYDLSMSEVNAFINWYDTKDAGSGPSKYAINKHNNNKGPFNKRIDYVIFNNILTFEVNEYTATSATYN